MRMSVFDRLAQRWWLKRHGLTHSLRGADLAGRDLRRGRLAGLDLSGADLSRADLRDADLRGTSLSGASLSGADLGDTWLAGADLTGADLSGARLEEAHALGLCCLSGADLRGQDLSGRHLNEAKLSGARLGGAVLRGTSLYEADLTEADLCDANLFGTALVQARLDGARLRGADLEAAWLGGAFLRDADLCHARLADACLRGADLTGASLAEAVLAGAAYDAETRWPEGFDPDRRGALRLGPPRAAILTAGTESAVTRDLLATVRQDGGYAEVTVLNGLPLLLPDAGATDERWRCPHAWRDCELLLLDDSLGARLLLDFLERLRRCPMWLPARIVMLEKPPDSLVFEFFRVSPDCTLDKPVSRMELGTFLRRIRGADGRHSGGK
jgi:uncharacterized protein YjbI with pentapeptide repeats